ncbi:hypothetical protein CFOL_v3_17438 [Cephalotus follicularis]|uniref:Uncharacterized protein n=1 Tax=Cephalotus follicularis TaxID=3775 RepID=A0A1Q3C110_CEPFO|nr:hypothetical protein CFOL_v3_17438 [Cephalotus follicularis]
MFRRCRICLQAQDKEPVVGRFQKLCFLMRCCFHHCTQRECSVRRFQISLRRSVWFQAFMDFMPNPPSCTGRHTFNHFTRLFFEEVPLPPHKNFLINLSHSTMTALGSKKMLHQNSCILAMVDLMSWSRPA